MSDSATNSIFDFFMNIFQTLFAFLNNIVIEYGSFKIYYGWMLIAFMIFALAMSVFWKGARQ